MSDEDLIRQLAALTPAPAADATTIAFVAGRRSARTSLVRWRIATGVAIVLAATMLPLRTHGERPTLAATAPPRSVDAASPPIAPLPPDNVIALRDAVLAHGLAGLPPLPRSTSVERPISMRELLGGDL